MNRLDSEGLIWIRLTDWLVLFIVLRSRDHSIQIIYQLFVQSLILLS